MLSKNTIKYTGFRIKWSNLGLLTFYTWDSLTQQVLLTENYYIYLNNLFIAPMAFMFCMAHILHMYFRFVPDIDDSAEINFDLEPLDFATLVIQCGEVIVCAAVGLCGIVIQNHREDLRYCFNQIIAYNNTVLVHVKEKRIQLDENFKKRIKMAEYVSFVLNLFCFTVPLTIVICIVCPFEPCHIIFKEWFDLEIFLEIRFLPFYIVSIMGFYSDTNVVHLLGSTVLFYYSLATNCFEGFTPESICHQSGARCKFVTKIWNALEDEAVVSLYRTQQLINELFNEIFGNVLIAFHHVAILSTVSILVSVLIKYSSVVAELGMMAYIVLIALVLVPLLIFDRQSNFCGELANLSNNFIYVGSKIVGRKTYFRKFSISCGTFYMQVAYPFYTVHRETMLLFVDQILNYIITILLW